MDDVFLDGPVTDDAAPLTFVATCDLAAQVRGRAVPRGDRAAVLTTGVGWVPANLAIDAFGVLAEPNEFGAAGDLRLVPDPASAVVIAADRGVPGAELLLGDQRELDGSPWPCCPRTFLRTATDLLAEHGLRALVAFEHEFHLFDTPPEPPFSFRRLRAAEPFGSGLVAALQDAGLQPQNWLPEYGKGQFEITVAPAEPVVAADRAILLREIVRDLARRHGRRVSFAPMVDPDDVGNGVHVHLSLVDARTQAPVLFDPALPGNLSAVGALFAAGVLAHAPALTAVTACSPASFLRLVPHHWSVGAIFLGERNREALLRICPVDASRPEQAAAAYNLEFRAADATANPYLALGALLRAGLSGLAEKLPAPRVWQREPTDDELRALPALPRSLPEVLAAFEADAVAYGWFDERLVRTHLSVKRSELAQVEGLDAHALCRKLSDVY